MANIVDPITQFFSSPAKGRNLLIVIVLLLSVIGFGSLIFWNNRPDYQVLFSNLSQEDAGEILTKIKEKKIQYQLTNSGTTILIPRDQVYDTRISLAAEGLPKGGGIGFEVFDRTNLGTTDFVQKLNYQRALQGELSRTIKQIKEVEQARVHIVTPKESLFVEEQKKPTASVFIKTRSGMTLGAPQVEGIVHLVASAVEGLEPGNITVVDTSGKILSKRIEPGLIGQLTTGQLEYQRNIEEGLKKKIQGMLEEVLGLNRAIARVSTEIDFQEVNIVEESYDSKPVIRSEQRSSEKSSSTTGGNILREGKSEAPPDQKAPKGKATLKAETSAKASPTLLSSPSSTSSSQRQNEIRNYEISKVNRQIKNPVGSVKRISVAVIVDGTYKETAGSKGTKTKQYVARPPEEMKNLEAIIKRAIGYNEKRGDQVELINMPFSWSIQEEDLKPEKGVIWKEYVVDFYKPVVSLLLALLFIFFVVRPLLQRRPLLPQEKGVPLLAQGEQSAVAEAPQVTGAKRPPEIKGQILQLVQQDPSRTAGIVKTWLREKE
jgi:flagellar M-ring protein FliF